LTYFIDLIGFFHGDSTTLSRGNCDKKYLFNADTY